ncbi:hypothetical protein [Priestia filamentosa]|uniref:hypothetical protein n=1 Tax=Priestia filamentosa TaxID=1402861 RepID=UPI000E73892C|nr:hypothetical protein [Priestia filamentosa]RJS62918.1 hypothetical protein CJ485_24825 [Priestia filamentosa]
MKAEIRAGNKEDFPLVHLFYKVYENRQLQTFENTAEKLLKLLLRDTFGRQTVVEELTFTTTS